MYAVRRLQKHGVARTQKPRKSVPCDIGVPAGDVSADSLVRKRSYGHDSVDAKLLERLNTIMNQKYSLRSGGSA